MPPEIRKIIQSKKGRLEMVGRGTGRYLRRWRNLDSAVQTSALRPISQPQGGSPIYRYTPHVLLSTAVVEGKQ